MLFTLTALDPTGTCTHCTGRDGRSKRTYPSEEDACRSAECRQARGGPRLRAYRCPWGDGWHLTME